MDRDSEVTLLSPTSPKADCNPAGRPVLDKSFRDNSSTSPGERAVQVLYFYK